MVSLKQSHPVDTDTERTIESVHINRVEFKENVRARDKASKSVREPSVRIHKRGARKAGSIRWIVSFFMRTSIFSVSSRNAPTFKRNLGGVLRREEHNDRRTKK